MKGKRSSQTGFIFFLFSIKYLKYNLTHLNNDPQSKWGFDN